jgi:hypothetical protein
MALIFLGFSMRREVVSGAMVAMAGLQVNA